jgi:hypothetical protein
MRPAASVLILCAGLLAACSGATLPFSKATDAPPARSPPAIFVATITGLPAGQETAVFEALASAAADRGIRIGSGKVEDEFALTGEFEEFATGTGQAVRYRWTLADETGRVLHRIVETEAIPSADASVRPDGVPIMRIAAYTAENISSRLSQLGYATRAAGMPPPLDHLAQAGPGAEQEIDYETLHGPGGAPAADRQAGDQQATPQQATAESEPKAAGADQSIQGVAITRVEGAGETGNAELSAALARVLTDAGWPVMQRPGSNVLAIEGDVTLSQPTGEAQKVVLRWTVKAPNGDILGAVEQANDVPAGSLDSGWGKAADHAALAAAQGIFDLVDKLR